MITVILESQSGEILDKTSMIGNEEYLSQDDASFTFLSLLSVASCDVFKCSDMPELIHELERIRSCRSNIEEIKHIDMIIKLASRCHSSPGSTLVFTPFENTFED